jgi:hypothetical protein
MLWRRPNSEVEYGHRRADGSGSAVGVQCGRRSDQPRIWFAVLPSAPCDPVHSRWLTAFTVRRGGEVHRGTSVQHLYASATASLPGSHPAWSQP